MTEKQSPETRHKSLIKHYKLSNYRVIMSERTTATISFYCRESRADKNGFAPIEAAITLNGRRTFFSLPRKEVPKRFSKELKKRGDSELKEWCDLMRSRMYAVQTELIKQDIPITASTIRDYAKHGGVRMSRLDELIADFNKLLKSRSDVSKDTRQKYQFVFNDFLSYAPELLSDINRDTIQGFFSFLKSKYEESTASVKMAKIRTLMRYAFDNGKIRIYPFNGIKIPRKPKPVEFLTEEEISIIRQKEMPNERLERVRDCFLFECYTGIAFIDMKNLKPSDFKKNDEGQIYIKKKRNKTGIDFLVVLMDAAVEIAQKYKFKIPILSNQKYNSYLKELADLCNIRKSLHSHIGRHTCACLLLNRGVSLEVVAKVLGHSTIKHTQHYAKLLDKTVFEAVQQIEGKS